MQEVQRQIRIDRVQANDVRSESLARNVLARAVVEHYRCPEDFLDFELSDRLSTDEGYFNFSADVICYGRSCQGTRARRPESSRHDTFSDVTVQNAKLRLPFHPTEIINNLRWERYVEENKSSQKLLKKIYYHVRPFMTASIRARVKQFLARKRRMTVFPKWPLDTTVENICERLLSLSIESKNVQRIPFIWFWPNGANGCVTITHDVETETGRAFCADLMDLNESFGIKSSFQIIPEQRYEVMPAFLDSIRSRGFEVAVHDLNHDGRLYDERGEFLRRAKKINQYAAQWGAKGFRAGALYRKPDWFESLDFSYEMSMPNIGHLDPQPGGCCTVMPFSIGDMLEIPVTMIQDYMLFYVVQSRSIDLWKTQIEMILRKNGLASFIVHPDYIVEKETRCVYENLLSYLRDLRLQTDIWFALPRDIDSWWRSRSQLRLERCGDSWQIEGEGAERAVVAYAKNVNGRLVYEVERPAKPIC